MIDKHSPAAYRAAYQKRRQRAYDQRETERLKAYTAVKQATPAVLRRYPAVEAAYLFGSVIRPGAFHRHSDIDIAIEPKLGGEDYFALWHELEAALPHWAIDLRDLPPDTRFTERVKATGEKFYDG